MVTLTPFLFDPLVADVGRTDELHLLVTYSLVVKSKIRNGKMYFFALVESFVFFLQHAVLDSKNELSLDVEANFYLYANIPNLQHDPIEHILFYGFVYKRDVGLRNVQRVE